MRLGHRAAAGQAAIILSVGLSGAAAAQTLRNIVVNNECTRPIQMIVHHLGSDGIWITNGWYKFDANDADYSYVRSNGVRLVQRDGENLYFYAETIDDKPALHWRGGGLEVNFKGTVLTTMKADTFVNDNGELALNITCP